MKTTLAVALVTGLVSLTSAAHAQEGRSGVGVGAEITNTGLTGGTFVYDAGQFHIDALLALRNVEDQGTAIGVGGRFFFVLHRGQSADFSIGGGLGFVHENPEAGDSTTDIHLEGAAQIRAFLAPSVAFSTSLGLGIVLADGEDGGRDIITLGGHTIVNAGITYFFW